MVFRSAVEKRFD